MCAVLFLLYSISMIPLAFFASVFISTVRQAGVCGGGRVWRVWRGEGGDGGGVERGGRGEGREGGGRGEGREGGGEGGDGGAGWRGC